MVECDAGSLGSDIPVFDMDRETQVRLDYDTQAPGQLSLNQGYMLPKDRDCDFYQHGMLVARPMLNLLPKSE